MTLTEQERSFRKQYLLVLFCLAIGMGWGYAMARMVDWVKEPEAVCGEWNV